MIAYPIRRFFFDKFPNLGKPIVLCAACMSSLWGTVIFWVFYTAYGLPIDVYSIVYWIGVCISSSFISAVFWTYYDKMFIESD